ncbi:MAG: hypothetical protein HY007_02105 [Candidatus Sungbacteria bacterium]|nr:hypothetical protein [Candidatus Sungbacteria bacterium]
MTQDFSKKMTVVLREDLASWQLTNTIGHIAAYLGNKMSEPFDTGEFFVCQACAGGQLRGTIQG